MTIQASGLIVPFEGGLFAGYGLINPSSLDDSLKFEVLSALKIIFSYYDPQPSDQDLNALANSADISIYPDFNSGISQFTFSQSGINSEFYQLNFSKFIYSTTSSDENSDPSLTSGPVFDATFKLNLNVLGTGPEYAAIRETLEALNEVGGG